ncbi:MCE family protein [Massilia forsythiae]|uniref:MCE family protein n=1 Tax=Massilia forsythiae TaxID=2728020 RepID=A0A7Z2VZG8_9BURK|nr:MlaD family protein [Massilia forsythiae]QJE01732.1 MCE family protein [Massilia forsythiae]
MKRNALMIGAFVIATLVVIVAAIIWLSGSDLFTKQQKASVYYEGNVSGLSVGAPVTFRGVTIGQVTAIGINVDGNSLRTTVPVSLKLQPSALNISGAPDGTMNIPTLVARGLRARLASQSIVTGQKGIELDFVPHSPAILHGVTGGGAHDPEIPAVADRFGALIDQVAELPLRDTVNDMRATVQDLQKTLVSVRDTLSTAQALLGTASTELKATTVDSRKTLETATEAIRRVQDHSAQTLEAVTRLANTSNDTVAGAQPELQRTLVEARQASEAARLAMERVADLAAPGAPMRSDLEGTVRDLSQAARGLRSLSELLEEKPNALIFGNKSK